MRTHNGMLSYVCAVCRLVCYRPSKRGTEDGVRDDGGWAGDTWYRRGAPSKAGGPRSVRVCRSLKGKASARLAANHLVDTVRECGARSVTSATADGLAPEGASQTKKVCLQVIKKRPRKKFCLQVIKKRPRKPDVADVHEWCSAATGNTIKKESTESGEPLSSDVLPYMWQLILFI
ncbi:hypothetical protein EVAR_22638_1 [Eumeta japonica]|uniref:Uncharacterized protein n=1 Tax=Eumeta variegata TaxID=151549 RepID=A0A4C1VMW0_EUMVA|nr:hypothetical protein EVAR_22638_1 [Eumeta japonica]